MRIYKTLAVITGIAGFLVCSAGHVSGQTITLKTVALTNANMVLSGSSFNETGSETPRLYYMNEGVELILPKKKFLLSEKNPAQRLTIHGGACDLTWQDGSFGMTVGGKTVPLVDSRLGFRTVEIPVGATARYHLAFPRGYDYKKEGHLFVRSGAVQEGIVDGLAIRLYDDDLDGKYVKGTDGISVGDSSGMGVFGTLSSVMPGANTAYEIGNVAEDGSSVTLDKYAGATGQLKVDVPKGFECRMAFASEDGKCSFGMLAGESGLTLPAGKYRMQYGFIHRPRSRRLTALLLPSKNFAISVGSDEKVSLVMGDIVVAEMSQGDEYATMDLQHFLELDLSGVEVAANEGDFAKAKELFGAITGKYKGGPNHEVSKDWIEELRQRLAFETSPEGKELRDAEATLMASVKAGKLDEAKAQLPAVKAALAKMPTGVAQSWLGQVHKARVAGMERFAAGTARPGLKCPAARSHGAGRDRADGGIRVSMLPDGKPTYAENVDWTTKGHTSYAELAKMAHRPYVYEGYLVAPATGEYEIALESGTGGGKVDIDGKEAFDHWTAHLPEERGVRLKLTEGRHAIKIMAYAGSGREHCLHLRWTPPGGRKTIVPTWALECDK